MSAPPKVPFYNNPKIRGIIFQSVMFLAVFFFFYFAWENAANNIKNQKIATGFSFLNNTASFQIAQTLIEYHEGMSYGRALIIGILNTLLVAALGIFFATILGFTIGIARLSNNWVVSKMSYWYVEFIRNLPLLFQLVFWYLLIISVLPAPRGSLALLDLVFLNQRGLSIAKPLLQENFKYVTWAWVIGAVVSIYLWRKARKVQMLTGERKSLFLPIIFLLLVIPALLFFVLGQPATLEKPALSGFNVRGGLYVMPELFALLIGLVTYTAGFIAEIVRSGIQAVSWGQTEAGRALGLRDNFVTRLIVIPQALRVIIPPLTSQFLNITKNSSLAVAIGYPDLVSVGQTILNQSGQAIEIIALWMGVYLSISICVSIFMNWYNAKIALVER